MRNAAATGTAAHAGMFCMLAYTNAPSASSSHPAPTSIGIAVMIALVCAAPLLAKDPPPDLAKRVAHRESETAEERRQYAYSQSVRLQEMDGRGVQTGEYREVREVIFSPTGDRTERFSGQPVSKLRNLILTPEDFADIRNILPF